MCFTAFWACPKMSRVKGATIAPVPAGTVEGSAAQNNTVSSAAGDPIMPQHVVFGVRTWLGLIALAGAILGGGWLLYTRAEDRVVRLEERVERGQAETARTLSDIRVQLATLLAKNDSNDAS